MNGFDLLFLLIFLMFFLTYTLVIAKTYIKGRRFLYYVVLYATNYGEIT